MNESLTSDDLKNNFEKVNKMVTESAKEDFMFVSNNINIVPSNGTIEKKCFSNKEIGIDTSDLLCDNTFDFENLKNNYMNNMISWSFLKKLSDFNQWPLGCIANFVENSLKEEVNTKNIAINMKGYNKKVYTDYISKPDDFSDKILVLSITDDGQGIPIKDFNQIMYSFSTNEKKENNFFRYGISMKTSAIRLANSFLLISKTENDLSIGLMSKNLQTKLDSDFLLTPIVNFKIEGVNKYVPKSNFAGQSFNLILQEIKFIFKSPEEFFAYVNTFETGTHIILYDLKQLSPTKAELNKIENYELLMDSENNDILFNYFNLQIGERNFVDCSLSVYLNYLLVKHPSVNLTLLDKSVGFKNPYKFLHNISKNIPEVTKVHTNLKCSNDAKPSNCIYIDGDLYRGILFNQKYIDSLIESNNFNFESSENDFFNGILIYCNNRLVCRFGQNNLGDISYFLKKYTKHTGDNLFNISGYIEVPASFYEVLYNKMEFKDQAIYALLYSKVKNILGKLSGNK